MTTSYSIPDNIDELVEEYCELRPVLKRLHAELSKLIRKDDMFACAKRLKMLVKQDGKKVIRFEHEHEMDIFQDYLLYTHRPQAINAAQQMLNAKRYPNESQEGLLLEGMAKARFSVFIIKQIIKDYGFIGMDIQSGDDFFIMDQTLPQQDVVGMMIGFRIFPFRGYWMHTGANISLARSPDLADFKPIGVIDNQYEERDLNEATIFKIREMISESY
jgi:hypothetical protein